MTNVRLTEQSLQFNAISTERNTKADALLVAIEPKERWCVVYEYPDQARAITQNARRAEVAGFRPALPRDLEVCRSCVVTGWSSRSFARRLWAHTPRRITAFVDARSASQFCERMLESSSSPSASYYVFDIAVVVVFLGSLFSREFAGVTGLVFKTICGRDGFRGDFGRGRYENLSGAISWLTFLAGGAADVRRCRSDWRRELAESTICSQRKPRSFRCSAQSVGSRGG